MFTDTCSCVDQMGRSISLEFPAKRIISLVPSQTELLADLGLSDAVVGITKFCIHPASWKTKTIVGGTKNFHFDVIDQLKTDLIIGSKEENYKEGIEHLQKKYTVWMSDIHTMEDAKSMIQSIGHLTGRRAESELLAGEIDNAFSTLEKGKPSSVLYLIWRKPWMAAASGTFIDHMLAKIGLTNSAMGERYPELESDTIMQLNPDYVFLSSEPYPFREKHIDELKKLCPTSTIMLVDGEMFSWYGSRLKKAPAYFRSLNLPKS